MPEAPISSRLRREEVNTTMQLTVTGKHIDTNALLRQHVEERLEAILDKYFKTAIEAHVVFSKEAHLRRAEVSIHIGSGIGANASAVALETYAAFDAAAERIAKQMRRYKRRLQNHHMHAREAFDSGAGAKHYVAAPFDSAGGRGEGPSVAAEMSPDLPTPQVPRRER
jgi:ribosomal subunit interface protein